MRNIIKKLTTDIELEVLTLAHDVSTTVFTDKPYTGEFHEILELITINNSELTNAQYKVIKLQLQKILFEHV